jgi:uncharacterized protein YuzE
MVRTTFNAEVVIDWEADALYIQLADEIEEGEARVNKKFTLKKNATDVVFDINSQGKLLGIEILGIEGLLKRRDLNERQLSESVVSKALSAPLLKKLALINLHDDVLGQYIAAGAAVAGSQVCAPWGTATAGAFTSLLGY